MPESAHLENHRDGRRTAGKVDSPLMGIMAQDGWQLVYITSRKPACSGPSPMSTASAAPGSQLLEQKFKCLWTLYQQPSQGPWDLEEGHCGGRKQTKAVTVGGKSRCT